MKGKYRRFSKAVQVLKKVALYFAMVVLENQIFSFDVQNTIMVVNGPRFVSKFFAFYSALQQTNPGKTTENYLQANVQVERSN